MILGMYAHARCCAIQYMYVYVLSVDFFLIVSLLGPARAAEDCGRERQSLDPHTGEDQSTGATDRWGSLREHENNGNPNPRNQY